MLKAKPDDVVRFSPAANNTYSMVFQGDDVGLSGATIDALAVDPATKDLILSFTLSRTVTGLGTVPREDLVAFHPTSLGATTLGTFRLFFDGSDIGLTAAPTRTSTPSTSAPTGRSTSPPRVPSTSGRPTAPAAPATTRTSSPAPPPAWGAASACAGLSTYRTGVVPGTDHLTENVDAFDLTADGEDLISTTGNYNVPGSAGQGTDALTCKAGTCSRFFTGTNHSLLRLADIETGTLLP